MAYCTTGPAIGPEGRGHMHEVNCPPSALAGITDIIPGRVFTVAAFAAIAFFIWRSETKKKPRKMSKFEREVRVEERQFINSAQRDRSKLGAAAFKRKWGVPRQ